MRSLYQHTGNLRISYLTCLLFFLLFFTIPEFAVGSEESFEELVNLDERWFGDFDGMVKRRKIRALVTYNKTNYFLDHGRQRGISYELLKEFERSVNKELKRKRLRINIIFIPVSRDELIPMLVEGRADIAVASLTITPERQKLVDFSIPVYMGVNEIVVTGPTAPSIRSIDDLSGKVIYVNASTSYYETLLRLNESFKHADKPPVKVKAVDEHFETEDILEMVNAGLIPMTIADNYLAEFWVKIFDNLTLHPKTTVRTGGQIAWMIRKNTPKFTEFYRDTEGMELLNKILFTFASYNAGPTRIVQLRSQTIKMGLDPNKWFNNTEVAAAKRIGRETVQYVSNIYKYWIAYRIVLEQDEES